MGCVAMWEPSTHPPTNIHTPQHHNPHESPHFTCCGGSAANARAKIRWPLASSSSMGRAAPSASSSIALDAPALLSPVGLRRDLRSWSLVLLLLLLLSALLSSSVEEEEGAVDGGLMRPSAAVCVVSCCGCVGGKGGCLCMYTHRNVNHTYTTNRGF